MRFFIAGALILLSAFLLPITALAAGFASQSIFLSKSPVTEGDTVRIYAIVTNETAVQFTGSVVVKEGDTKIGSQAVSLAAGATQTASVPWTPVAGSHDITADLVATDGSVAEEKSETFTVDPKPAPPPPTVEDVAADAAAIDAANQAAVESSQGIQQQISSVSPQAESAAAPVFNFIDSLRTNAGALIDSQLAATQPKVTTSALPADGMAPSTQNWAISIAYTIYFYVLTILAFIIDKAGVFYPVLAIAFLYLLWRLFRRFRRA